MSNITEKTLPDIPREATLTDVLEAREKRVSCQQRLLERFRKPVVCFTLNIAGPVKVDEATCYAFRVGRERLTEGLKTMGFDLLASETLVSVAGQEYLAAVNAPAEALKRLCVSLEELDQLGRLFDLDVIGTDGQKLERGAERSCLVCGKPGRGCASRRVHPVDEIRAVTQGIIQAHRTREQTRRVATAAVQSLLDEVCVTPKPGLVDRENNGSHRDMDIFTFTSSASALYPYFEACCLAGLRDRALDAETAFRRLQSLGIEAERVMRQATHSVNTHKGAIFTLGVLCAAAGRAGDTRVEPWLHCCAELAASYRSSGVRGEVADGLPSVAAYGLPALRAAREKGCSFNDQCLAALLALIAHVEDTNMVSRGGNLVARRARAEAQALIDALESGAETRPLPMLMEAMNRDYVALNLSPGGCADLLAATLLVDRITPSSSETMEE